ncbi:putative parathyroid hormone 2 receptor [Trichinella spiralis]|uniref:putative parathyroid hormone 2 receptor n=1 Tax=Trichinella spiralis TaxID=6334 RepID=UPI0001EFBA45|nr:putative parathyroid hormone 2 receptor [Trichinella spiralis]
MRKCPGLQAVAPIFTSFSFTEYFASKEEEKFFTHGSHMWDIFIKSHTSNIPYFRQQKSRRKIIMRNQSSFNSKNVDCRIRNYGFDLELDSTSERQALVHLRPLTTVDKIIRLHFSIIAELKHIRCNYSIPLTEASFSWKFDLLVHSFISIAFRSTAAAAVLHQRLNNMLFDLVEH